VPTGSLDLVKEPWRSYIQSTTESFPFILSGDVQTNNRGHEDSPIPDGVCWETLCECGKGSRVIDEGNARQAAGRSYFPKGVMESLKV
jgi:hypothetical protein